MNYFKLTLLSFLLFLVDISYSTTTYTIGATGTYSSIAAAWAAFPSPITDDYVLEIKTDYVQESIPINLTAVNGASSTNTIIIRPETGNTGLTIFTSFTFDLAVFYFDGADYVTIDGRPGGVGSATDLTITHSATGMYSSFAPEEPAAIVFINDATNNVVKYCNLKGEADASTGTNVALGGVVQFRTGVTTGNSNNTIDNCKITQDASIPDCLLYSSGTVGAENQDNTVSNCEFFESRYYYIRLEDNNDSWSFLGNSFYQGATVAGGGSKRHLYMLYVSDGGGYTVTNNYFGGKAANCGSTAYVLNNYSIKGIYFDSGVNGSNIISSNTFSNWDISMTSNAGTATTGDVLECIYAGGSANYTIGSSGNGNVFGSSVGTASIDIETNSNGAKRNFEGITHSSSGTSSIAYNTFGDILIQSGGSSAAADFKAINNTNGNTTIAYNTIGHANSAANIVIQNSVTYGTGNTYYNLITNSSNTAGNISNNTFQNITDLITSASYSTGENYMIGLGGSGTHTVVNNTIGNANAGNMDFDRRYDNSVFYCYGSGSYNINNNNVQNWDFSNAYSRVKMLWNDDVGNSLSATYNTFKNINFTNTGGWQYVAYIAYYEDGGRYFSNNTVENVSSTGLFTAFYGEDYNGTMYVENNTIGGTSANSIVADYAATYSTSDNDRAREEPMIFRFIGRDADIGNTNTGVTVYCNGNTFQNITYPNAGTLGGYIINLQDRHRFTNQINNNIFKNISYTGVNYGNSVTTSTPSYTAVGLACINVSYSHDGNLSGRSNNDTQIEIIGNTISDIDVNSHFFGIRNSTVGQTTIEDNIIGSTDDNNITSLGGDDEMFGIFHYGGAGSISNNTIQEFENQNTTGTAGFYGIFLYYPGILDVNNNTVREIDLNILSGYVTSGVYWNSNDVSGSNNFIGNTIKDIHFTNAASTQCEFYAVHIDDVDGGGNFKKNYIGNCSFAGNATSSKGFYGVYNEDDGLWDFHNNVILWDNDNVDGQAYYFYCMRDNGSAANTWYHNTMYVSGTHTGGSTSSWSVGLRQANSSSINYNNVFKNDRTGPGNEYSFYRTAGTLTYNYYEGGNTNGTSSLSNTAAVGTITIDANGYVTNDPNLHVEDAGMDLFTGATVIDDKDNVTRDVTPWRGAFEAPSILPVELSIFTASTEDNKTVDLAWITLTEINNDFFTVERSQNGIDWETLLTVTGAGNSQQLISYLDIDLTPFNGISYYRLKQTDFDGNYTYSEIKSVFINTSVTEIGYYPNPVKNSLTVINLEDHKEIQLFDLAGREVNISPISNLNKVTIDMTTVAVGSYILKTSKGTIKIVKD